jgi:hypothetical protein
MAAMREVNISDIQSVESQRNPKELPDFLDRNLGGLMRRNIERQ